VHDLADDAARRHDLIAALQGRQQLAVLLLLAALWLTRQEVEDRENRSDLEHEGDQPRTATLSGRN
jgi:hypothetical protein